MICLYYEAEPSDQVAVDCILHICGTVVCSVDVFFIQFWKLHKRM